MTQAALAFRLGIDSQTLSRWETGRSQPRAEEAERLRRETGIVVYESEATLTERVAALEAVVAALASELRDAPLAAPGGGEPGRDAARIAALRDEIEVAAEEGRQPRRGRGRRLPEQPESP